MKRIEEFAFARAGLVQEILRMDILGKPYPAPSGISTLEWLFMSGRRLKFLPCPNKIMSGSTA